jgi:hypothetical protein
MVEFIKNTLKTDDYNICYSVDWYRAPRFPRGFSLFSKNWPFLVSFLYTKFFIQHNS